MSNEKTRILCVITQSEIGGAQQFLAQLTDHLDHGRFEMTVLAGQDGHDQLKPMLPPDVRYLTAVHLRRKPGFWDDIMAVFELRRIFRELSPDIILLNSSKAGFNGSLAARWPTRLPGMRIIYRIGGWTFNDPWPAWKRYFYICLEKLSARWKDIIVVNNTHDLEQAHRLGIRPRISLKRIFNGIEPYRDVMSPEAAREKLFSRMTQAKKDQPYDWLIGTIANFYPTKDLVALVQAASRVSENVRFVIIGDGPQRPLLERRIIEYGLENRFFLVGRLPGAADYLPAFDAFVLPSVKEGFPWSLLEAMAAKVPVIATRVGAVPEMLVDRVSGLLVDPGRPEDLAKAIVEMLVDERLRRESAIKAHQMVISRFSLREMVSQYESLFSQK